MSTNADELAQIPWRSLGDVPRERLVEIRDMVEESIFEADEEMEAAFNEAHRLKRLRGRAGQQLQVINRELARRGKAEKQARHDHIQERLVDALRDELDDEDRFRELVADVTAAEPGDINGNR